MSKEILGRAANMVGEVASQAAATAAQWYRLDSEQRRLATLRAHALQLRAQIGEEMYKLWQSHVLPPSSLDHLFRDIDRTMAAIDAQRARVEELRSHFVPNESTTPPADPLVILDQDSHLQVVEQQLAPPPVPAAPTQRLAADSAMQPAAGDPAAVPCPTCRRAGPAGKAFCGYCGTRLC